MSDKNFLSKNAAYVQSLVDFINDVKPYRCKLTSVIEEYRFAEDISVKFEEQLFLKVKLSPTWTYNYFSGANALFRTLPAQRLVQPTFNRRAYEVGRDEVNDLVGIPFVYSKKSFDGPGVNSVYVRRASGAVEPLVESVDYFQSHGSFQFQVKQTTNANGDFDPTWSTTTDDGLVAAASAHTRGLALDSSNPSSAVSRIKAIIDEVQAAALAAATPIDVDVQRELNAIYAVLNVPEIPRSYEALLAYIGIANPPIVPYIRTNADESITTVDTQRLEQELSNLTSPLFFGGYGDMEFRQSGKLSYADVTGSHLSVTNVTPNLASDVEEWTLIAAVDDKYEVVGSTTGFIGFAVAGESFNSGRISFQTELVAAAPIGTKVTLTPSNKIVIREGVPLETWNIIKVNSIAHDRPLFTSARYGNIQDLAGNTGSISILDQSLPTTNLILTARAGGQFFDLISTTDSTHTGVAQVGVTYNDLQVGFKLQAGVTPFREGDRFFIGIENLPAQAENIDLGYGYDLDPFDNDNLVYNNIDPGSPHYNRKVGFYYDGRFTDYDLSALNIQVAQGAADNRKWRIKAKPSGDPVATLKKDGSGPSHWVDLTDATSGVDPDPVLGSVPLYSMAGDLNPAPDLELFYATEFDVQFSDDDFSTSTSIGSVTVGNTFQSILHGVQFSLPAASRPFIAVSADGGLGASRVGGGDVFSFTVRNPAPTLTETPVTLTAASVPRLILHSDSFYDVPTAKWVISFTSPTQYSVTAVQPDGASLPGTPLSGFLPTAGVNEREGLSFKGLGIHFTLPSSSFAAGDKFTFTTFAEKPSYLVRGSVTGWTAPAFVGKYYWNGYIGFKLTAPDWNVFVDDVYTEAEDIGLVVNHLREDIPSLTYTFTAFNAGYRVNRSDQGLIGYVTTAAGEFKDKYVHVNLADVTIPEFKLDINAHDYALWNSADVVILSPKNSSRLPALGETVVVEKTENGRLEVALSPGTVNISDLGPVTVDPRFVDTYTNQATPLSNTSPETALMQGWLPLITEARDSATSVAEFSDVATGFIFKSAASDYTVGSLKQLDPTNLNEPIAFEWDTDFFADYLPLNAEANVVISNSGWADKLRARITESVKFMIGPGALTEDWLFRDDFSASFDETFTLSITSALTDSFTTSIQDSPFTGFLPGYGNTPYDIEGFDTGQPPDIYSLLAKAGLMAQERRDVLDRWDNFLLDKEAPTTAEQWEFMLTALATDLNPDGVTDDMGLPAQGVALDVTSSPAGTASASIQELMTLFVIDQPRAHDVNPYDTVPLDTFSDSTAVIHTGLLPPVPAIVSAGATYANFETPLHVNYPVRVFEVTFSADPVVLGALSPIFSVWLPTEVAPLPVPVVEQLALGRYRFSIAAPSEAKLIIN